MAIKMDIKVGTYYIVVLFDVALAAAEAIRSFRCSPGYATSNDATSIASTPPHGHQNGQRWRCICLLPPPFLLGVIIAKDHVMVL